MARPEAKIDVNHVLHQLFQAHRVEATQQDGSVLFPETDMRADATITQEIKRPTALTVELEVRFEFTPGRIIVEGFAGVGATTETAIADAFGNFVANSFHVLLSAFLLPGAGAAPGEDAQVSHEVWVLGGEARQVTVGNLGVRGKPPVPGEQLVGLVQQFEQWLKQQALAPGTHWVRLYYGQAKGTALACEVLLDNQPWQAMQSHVAALGWPAGEGFYSVRLFLVIAGQGGSRSSSAPPVVPPAPRDEAPQSQPSKWRFWRH